MPAAAYTTMTISDSTATADLVDGVNYQLLKHSYAPAIAARRRMNMAARQPFVNAIEGIKVDIKGADRAETLANLAKLTELLDRAERWEAGDQIDPVIYAIQPQGSVLADPLRAIILGRPPNSAGVILPADFNDLLVIDRIEGVVIQFIRRGLLIDEAESGVTAAAAANPTIREATFADSATIPSPVTVRITGWSDTEHTTIDSPSLLIITSEKEDIYLLEAEDMSPEADWAIFDDSANAASGGDVLRYTADDTDEYSSDEHGIDAASFNLNTEEVGIYAMIRGHATKDFVLWAETASYVVSSAQRTHPFVVAAGSYTSPTPVFLGTVVQRRGHRTVRLVARALDATGSPTLDVDRLVLVAMKSTTYIIQLGIMYLSFPFISETPSNVRIKIDPAALTDSRPFVGYEEISGEVLNPSEADVAYQGDGAIYLPGPTIATHWMGKRSAKWVCTDSGGDPTQVGLSAVRAKAYLSPR